MNEKERNRVIRLGYNAGLTGKTIEHCRFRLPEKKQLWIRAFHEGKLKAEFNQLTSQQRTDASVNITKLKSFFEKDSS